MNFYILISDQFFNWSENAIQIYRIFEKTTSSSCQKVNAVNEYGCAGISNRKIQALWKTQLQMCSRKRSWTKVLSFSQSDWWKADNEIYCSKKQRSFSKLHPKLFDCQKTFWGDQRNKHRTILTHTTIKISYEFSLQSTHVNSAHSKYAARPSKIGIGGRT